jgi:uncharacterized membrane-anchored protein
MARYKTFFVVASIVLALAGPLLMAVKAHQEQRAYPVVRVEIEPYDPRDLLYGHYMTFAFNWNWGKEKPDSKSCQGAHCCLCLGEGSEDPKASVIACVPEKPAQCAHVLKGAYYGDTIFHIGVDRYYVDENIALPLEDLFRNKKETFHVGLSISPEGKAILEKLYVSGKPVNQYVDEHGGGLKILESKPHDATSSTSP